MGLRLAFVVSSTLLAACYAPDPSAGAPCTTACPTPLVCDQVTRTCQAPGFIAPDAKISAPGVFRVPVTFEAATTGPVIVLVVLDAAVFPYAHAAGDGSDLRFGDGDPNNGYEYARWLETWTTPSSRVWVRANATNVGSNTMWAYYGLTGAAVANDFSTVFPDTFRSSGDTTLTGDITHDAFIVEAADTITATPGTPLTLSAAYMKISGTIDASWAGLAAGMGPGAGGTSTTGGAGGGGHGGTGGVGGKDAGDMPGFGGPVEGIADSEDIEMGAGGGTTNTSTTNGRGGGAIGLDALRIILDGQLLANGEAGVGSNRSGGGGAGGGVLVRAQSLEFTGAISARGGKGGQGDVAAGNDGGGGGGGGRIKLFQRGELTNTGTLNVANGAGGNGGNAAPGQDGAVGTTFEGMSTTLPALPVIGPEQTL